MADSTAIETLRYRDVEVLLSKYTRLRIVPTPSEDLLIAGPLAFVCRPANGLSIEDEYNIEMRVPRGFPDDLPSVWEKEERIPKYYHKLSDNSLCLGAPTAIRLRLEKSPSFVTFVDEFVVPYLAGYTHFSKTGKMLYGELAHGEEGIREYFAELFASRTVAGSEEFVRLASLSKRRANKLPCPCDSSRRLGRCHNCVVNHLRRSIGRKWFASEFKRVLKQLPSARNKQRVR